MELTQSLKNDMRDKRYDFLKVPKPSGSEKYHQKVLPLKNDSDCVCDHLDKPSMVDDVKSSQNEHVDESELFKQNLRKPR